MDEKARDESVGVGLCFDCANARRLQSAKGSAFWQCGLAMRDPRFRPYPQLPVQVCDGFQPASARRSGRL